MQLYFLSVSPQSLDPMRGTMIWKASITSLGVLEAHDRELILDPVRKRDPQIPSNAVLESVLCSLRAGWDVAVGFQATAFPTETN